MGCHFAVFLRGGCDAEMRINVKITVCDDSMEDLANMERLLIRYQKKYPQEKFKTEKYSDAMKLYNKVEKELSDIYILDMVMPLKSGIDLGKRIREKRKEIPIIYTTSSDEFALEAYGVQAARYLVKPFSEEIFFEAVDYAVSNILMKKEGIFIVKTKEGIVSIPYSRILYIENTARVMSIHLKDQSILESVFLRNSFENECKELLFDSHFIQVHKSFVVHMEYVEKLEQDQIVMNDGSIVPVSRKKNSEVKRKYLLYVTDRYRF